MDNVGMDTLARAAQFVARSQKLIALDAITTAALTSVELGQEDANMLRLIAAEIEQLFAYCTREIAWVDSTIRSREEDVLQQLRDAIDRSPLNDDAKNQLKQKLVDQGGLMNLVQRTTTDLPRLSDEEVQHLSQQITAAESGQPTHGDMKAETLCLLEGAGIGLLLLINPAAAVGVGLKCLTDCF